MLRPKGGPGGFFSGGGGGRSYGVTVHEIPFMPYESTAFPAPIFTKLTSA